MDISINCNVSLSKKLRTLLDDGGTIVLTAEGFKNGKGAGKLSCSSEKSIDFDLNAKDIGETSIMLEPIEVSTEVPTGHTVGSIFNTGSTLGSNLENKSASSGIGRLAVTTPPEQGEEQYAVVPQEEIQFPDEVTQDIHQDASYQDFVSNVDELMAATKEARNQSKSNNIDLDDAQNDRERAVLLELNEKSDAIDIDAWIVNDSVGMMAINDLSIDLPMNSPYNLGNISSRKISASKDLKAALKRGMIKFISPAEVENYTVGGSGAESFDLDVFSSPGEAEAALASPTTRDIDELALDEGGEELYEEEGMILNLTQSMPTNKVPVKTRDNMPEEGVRKTTHGQNPSQNAQNTQRPERTQAVSNGEKADHQSISRLR